MSKLNSTARLAFYNARRRQGDAQSISERTGYSMGHVTGVLNGTRGANPEITQSAYQMSRRRVKTSELA
jgi:hypothetical protein